MKFLSPHVSSLLFPTSLIRKKVKDRRKTLVHLKKTSSIVFNWNEKTTSAIEKHQLNEYEITSHSEYVNGNMYFRGSLGKIVKKVNLAFFIFVFTQGQILLRIVSTPPHVIHQCCYL